MFSYLSIKSKSYQNLLFTIPFWIVILSMIFKKTRNKILNKFNINLVKLISTFLIVATFVIGLSLLFIGGTKSLKDYIKEKAYLSDYEMYSNNTYRLIYTYEIDNIKYTIKSDYGLGYVPKMGSEISWSK